jgi:hypothetical protein
MKAEEKLILELMKGKAAKELYKKANWKEFIELCSYHRICPFIRKRLDERLVPKEALKELKEIEKKNVCVNLTLEEEMNSFFMEMQRKKIDFILIKGMALNKTIYQKTFERALSDIDFLIKEKNYLEVKEILESKGYKSNSFILWEKIPKRIKPFLFSYFYAHQHQYPTMEKEIQGINCMVEPHKELFFPLNSFSFELKEIWKDSKRIGSIRVPGNEDQIIISVVSSVYQHAFHGMLESLIDVKNISSKKVDFNKLKKKTVKYNVIEPMVYFNELMQEVFETEIKEIKELTKVADKKKLSFLRKNSLKKIVKKRREGFFYELRKALNRMHWAKNFKQKLKVFFLVFVLTEIWKSFRVSKRFKDGAI